MDWTTLTRELYKACIERNQAQAKSLWLEALRKNLQEHKAGQGASPQSCVIR